MALEIVLHPINSLNIPQYEFTRGYSDLKLIGFWLM